MTQPPRTWSDPSPGQQLVRGPAIVVQDNGAGASGQCVEDPGAGREAPGGGSDPSGWSRRVGVSSSMLTSTGVRGPVDPNMRNDLFKRVVPKGVTTRLV